jgi:hypothetical protein
MLGDFHHAFDGDGHQRDSRLRDVRNLITTEACGRGQNCWHPWQNAPGKCWIDDNIGAVNRDGVNHDTTRLKPSPRSTGKPV